VASANGEGFLSLEVIITVMGGLSANSSASEVAKGINKKINY